jgi:TolA-binding protein
MNRTRTSLALALLVPAVLLETPARGAEPPPAPVAANAVAVAPAATAESDAAAHAIFLEGYRLYTKKRYAEAAGQLYAYVSQHSRDDEDYDWAQFFLGISLKELGLSHAAVDTLAAVLARKPNVRVVSYSLEILEEITRTHPFDWETLVLNVLVDQEFGFVEGKLIDFVHYYQGLYDWEHGYEKWGDNHFTVLQPDSPYYHKYRYQKALYRVYAGDLPEAGRLLEELLADPRPTEDLKDEARVTLARLRYEQKDFGAADQAYRSLRRPTVEQARYLMERAWAQYREGNPEKAMGLLYAFRAPSFWRNFTPEYFILKSLIYKDVCQYRNAMAVVGEFQSRYGQTLEGIYGRRDPLESEQLVQILMEKPRIKRLYEFSNLLEGERNRARTVATGALAQYLDTLYGLKAEAVQGELRDTVETEYRALANDLLRYEEEAHLLEYEIGLDMYQRASDYHYPGQDREASGPQQAVVVYPFQEEFWNDELDDYQVVLQNKCETLQDWDIFFQ